MKLTPSTALGLFVIGIMVASVLYAAVTLLRSPPGAPFPSWRQPAASPTDPPPTPVNLPRTLRTATQGTP